MGERLPEFRRAYAAAIASAQYEYLEEDGEWYASIPGHQGVYATGETRAAAEDDLRGALSAWLSARIVRGLPLPPGYAD